jgi:hypothetical protein
LGWYLYGSAGVRFLSRGNQPGRLPRAEARHGQQQVVNQRAAGLAGRMARLRGVNAGRFGTPHGWPHPGSSGGCPRVRPRRWGLRLYLPTPTRGRVHPDPGGIRERGSSLAWQVVGCLPCREPGAGRGKRACSFLRCFPLRAPVAQCYAGARCWWWAGTQGHTGCLRRSCCPSATARPRRDPAVACACAKDVRTGLGFAEGSSGFRPAACLALPAWDGLVWEKERGGWPLGHCHRFAGLPVHGIRLVRWYVLACYSCRCRGVHGPR